MRFTVLGCHSPYPGPGGATAGYLIQTDGVNILLDCGSGVLSQLTKYIPVWKLDAVLLSHFHHDHVADLGVLQYAWMVHKNIGHVDKTLPLYGPDKPEIETRLTYKDVTRHVPVDENSTIVVGDITIRFLRTDHPMLCYAMRIEHGSKVIVYGADSGLKTDWLPFADNADLFICEGTYLDEHTPPPGVGHLKVSEAAEVARKIDCKSLIVTHLFPSFTEAQVLQEAKSYTLGPCYAAHSGLQIKLE